MTVFLYIRIPFPFDSGLYDRLLLIISLRHKSINDDVSYCIYGYHKSNATRFLENRKTTNHGLTISQSPKTLNTKSLLGTN